MSDAPKSGTTGNDNPYKVAWRPNDRYMLYKYLTVMDGYITIESNQDWPTRDEAQQVCDRVNAGDESGVTFASYRDD